MKLSILMMLCAVVVLATANEDEDLKEFKLFQASFGRRYRSANIEAERFGNFRKARAAVLKHNAAFERGEATYSVSINQFSDMTQSEIEQNVLGAVLPKELARRDASSEELESTLSRALRQATPNVDHRTKYPFVHNQQTCGSCWTFSATLAMEVAAAYKGSVEKLGQQYYVDCVNDGQSNACNGGWPTSVWNLVNATRGSVLETSYPYANVRQSCRSVGMNSRIKSVSYKLLTAAQIPAALQSGALACAIYAAGPFMQYKQGIFTDASYCPSNMATNTINHAVTIVGMTSSSYIVQNSWGTTWGNKGYFEFPRGKNTCNLESHCYSVAVNF